MRALTFAIVAALAASALPVAAQQRAGDAVRVQQDATQAPAGRAPGPFATGDTVFSLARLATTTYGSADVRLDDDTRLVIGPDTDVVIDEYVYQPQSTAGQATVRMGVGLLRMVTGRIPREGIRVTTPVATIGVRGTDFTLDTRVPGLLRVWVEDGIVEIIPNESGVVFDFAASAQADCTANFCRQGTGGAVPRAFPPRGSDNSSGQTGFGTDNDPDNAGGEGGGDDGGGRQ